MAAYEVLLLNTAIPQIQAAQAGDTYVVPRDIAFSTVASLAAGTEALPSLVATGDTNTGFWFPAADTIAASTGGTRRLTVDSSGNLGLGVPPSTWSSAVASQVGYGAALSSRAAGNTASDVTHGAYWNGTNWLYQNSSVGAARYQMTGANAGSTHAWFVSAGGTQNDPISFTQAMTLDASGNLLVGTTSSATGNVNGTISYGGTDAGIIYLLRQTGTDQLRFYTGGNRLGYVNTASSILTLGTANYPLVFATNDTERARITSGGYFKASNTGTYVSSTSTYHELRNDANANTVRISNSIGSGYTDSLMQTQFTGYTPNAATSWFLFCDDTTNQKAGILSTGTFESRTSTYGGVSDVKLKKDIVDASSQWDDLKAVRVRNFAFKDEPDTTMIGVIAQELEEVSPKLIYETPDRDKEGNNLGTTTKSVKYSVLYMKAIKALQEAMSRIETLEAEVAALKGN